MNKIIYYNQLTNQISLDQINWINSTRVNDYAQSIFDLNDSEWCSLGETKDQTAITSFFKEKITDNVAWYYKGYNKLNSSNDNILTLSLQQVEKNGLTNKWERVKWES